MSGSTSTDYSLYMENYDYFESQMYDRLGIQGSNDDISYSNLSVPWM